MLLPAPTVVNWRNWKLWSYGDPSLLDRPTNALLCSKACPGEKIVEAMDLAQRWRSENRAVISGFHTAVEKECLRIFLRGPQTIVVCPARGIDPFQLPIEWETKYRRSELLILSPFDSSVRRPTKETAELRNRLIMKLARTTTVIHATKGGMLEQLTLHTK
jgi:predicted Rossmann fold nucleotide-binding protein DprA/Smf involved in DNA uptake